MKPDFVYCSVQSTRRAMIVRAVKTAVERTENGTFFSMTTGGERKHTTCYSTVREAVANYRAHCSSSQSLKKGVPGGRVTGTNVGLHDSSRPCTIQGMEAVCARTKLRSPFLGPRTRAHHLGFQRGDVLRAGIRAPHARSVDLSITQKRVCTGDGPQSRRALATTWGKRARSFRTILRACLMCLFTDFLIQGPAA